MAKFSEANRVESLIRRSVKGPHWGVGFPGREGDQGPGGEVTGRVRGGKLLTHCLVDWISISACRSSALVQACTTTMNRAAIARTLRQGATA